MKNNEDLKGIFEAGDIITLHDLMKDFRIDVFRGVSGHVVSLGLMNIDRPIFEPKEAYNRFEYAWMYLQGISNAFTLDILIPEIKESFLFTLKQVERALDFFKQYKDKEFSEFNQKIFYVYLGNVVTAFNDDLSKSVFLVIDQKQAHYYTETMPFGKDVYDEFLDFRVDICNASKCFAFEQYDATVFYLMRIMESSAQKIGILLNATITKKKSQIAVNEAIWEDILVAIENQINDLHKQLSQRTHQVSPLVEAEPEKYRALMIQWRNVKNVWRNPVMHPLDQPILKGNSKDIMDTVEKYLRYLIPILKPE